MIVDLYENTLIGTFLYGLGLEVGARLDDKGFVSGVDLLQQTRLDQSLGDLLVRSARSFRLIEFKRASSRDPKEKRKRADIQRLIYQADDRDGLALTSIRIHRLVEMQHVQATSGHAQTVLNERAYFGGPSTVATIPQLCAATAVALMTLEDHPPLDDCARYLKLLARACAPVKRPSGGGGTLLIAVRDGIIEHAHVNDLTDLFRTQEQLRALVADREAEWERAEPEHPPETLNRDDEWER